jgi:hypothetical protein
MTQLAVVAALLALATALRITPLMMATRGAGVDHWYWKAWVETYRRERQFPPVLPQYILDEHQWYPPVFPLLLSLLPDRLFNRIDSFISVGVDLLRMLMLLAIAYWWTNGEMAVVAIAGLLYATTPILISYNIQLNPRGLAGLLLDALLVLLLLQFDGAGPPWVWGVILLLSALVLLTHKMTTQLFVFLMLGTALLYGHWQVAALLPAAVLLAIALSRGYYLDVLRSHWDIVTFWNRNWRWIGADLLRESPVYGDGSYERPEKLHRRGVRGVVQQLAILFGFNPAAWIACLLLYERLFAPQPVLFFPSYLLAWLLLTCLLSLLTTLVPRLKCLGAGYLYVMNASLMSSLLLATAFTHTALPALFQPFVLAALGCNVVAVATYYVHFRGNKRGRVQEGLDVMLNRLRTLPPGVVMCLPANWYDVVAYKTGQPVLWGGHGYGFRTRLEPTFPRFMMRITEAVPRYGIRYLLTMDGMMTPEFAAELPPSRRLSSGEYHLYCFDAPDAPPVQ